MMTRRIVYLFLIVVLFSGCMKEPDPVIVSYRVSQAYAPVDISYRDHNGDLNMRTIQFESTQDTWQETLSMQPGEIVYLSAFYSDSLTSVKIQIITDGKIYKEATSTREPDKYLIVSGVIPYQHE
jgi:hypothetical protein